MTASPEPDSERGFSRAQGDQVFPPGVEAHYWNRAKARIVHQELRALRRVGPVLELGCGPGVTVQYLRREGVDCVGCDLAPYDPVEPALAPHVFFEQDAFTLPRELRERFEVLLLLDVLEHLDDPAALLQRCREELPRLRHVLITLPARQELWSNYDVHYGHHLRYDRPRLRALCERPGLRLARARYFFHALYPPMALVRALRLPRPVVVRAPRWPRLHDGLSRLFAWESRWLPGSLPGTSLFGRVEVVRPEA